MNALYNIRQQCQAMNLTLQVYVVVNYFHFIHNSNQQQFDGTTGCQTITGDSKIKPVGKSTKKKGKTEITSAQPTILDQTCIHPESYNTAMR